MKIYKSNRTCPVCGGNYAEFLYKHRLEAEKIFEKLPDEFNIVSCDKCGFIYYDILSSQNIYDEYYEKFSLYEDMGVTYGVMNSDLKIVFEERAAEIKEYAKKDFTILDVGCANGYLLDILSSEGYNNLSGLDISEGCLNAIKNKGFNAFKGGVFSENHELYNKFDFVSMTQVLEHIYDVKGAITHIKNMLKEDGYLYIEVPDVSRYNEFSKYTFAFMQYEHINHFDPISLSNLAKNNGFDVLKIMQRDTKFNSDEITMPHVSIIMRNNNQVSRSKESFLEYTQNSTFKMEKMIIFLNTIKEDIALWGIGTSAMSLINENNNRIKFKYLIDSNTMKTGSSFNNQLILTPSELIKTNFSGVVVIATSYYEKEVIENIKRLGLKCKYISLFSEDYEIKVV